MKSEIDTNDMNDIERQAKRALDDSVDSLPIDVQQKLSEARVRALESHTQNWMRNPFVGFALAACLCLTVLLNFISSGNHDTLGTSSPDLVMQEVNNGETDFEDFMLLSSLDDSEMEIIEDIEFAYWLSEQLENETIPDTLHHGDLRNG